MNINDCAKKLLRHFPEECREIPDNTDYPGCNDDVKAALNGAMQEIYGLGKPWMRKDERGAILNAPAQLTISVTNGSTAAVIESGDWEEWFAGCSIVIDGASVDNQIRNETAASIILKYPYSGTTGTQNATIYHDSISLSADVLQVHEPVLLGKQRIHPLNNASGATSTVSTEDYGFHRQNDNQNSARQRITQTAGTPRYFTVDTWSPSDTASPTVRLRLYPAPSTTGFLEHTASLTPPRIDDLTSTDNLPIPFQFIESIFIPIATSKLKELSSFFRSYDGEGYLEKSYQTAKKLLRDGNPQRRAAVRIIQKY